MSHREVKLRDCSEFRQILTSHPPRLVHGLVLLLVLLFGACLLFTILTEVDLVVRAPGRIRPNTEPITIFTGETFNRETGARVTEVNFKKGDVVRRGDVLLRLDATHLDNQIAKLQRAIESSRQELRKLDQLEELLAAQFSTAKAKAEAELEQGLKEILLANQHRKAEIKLAELKLANTTDELTRLGSIANKNKNAVSSRSLFAAEIQVREASQQVARAKLPVDESGLNVLRHALTLVERERHAKIEEFEIRSEVKRGEIESACIELRNLQLAREQSVIRSTADGVVISDGPKLGNVIQSGLPIVEIACQEGFQFHAEVPDEEVAHLSIGMKTRIKLDAFDFQEYGIVEGNVNFVSPDSQVMSEQLATHQSAVYLVKVKLDRDSVGKGTRLGTVMLGLNGQAEIVTGQRRIFSILFGRIRQSMSL